MIVIEWHLSCQSCVNNKFITNCCFMFVGLLTNATCLPFIPVKVWLLGELMDPQ